jgi:hypothetical protein
LKREACLGVVAFASVARLAKQRQIARRELLAVKRNAPTPLNFVVFVTLRANAIKF